MSDDPHPREANVSRSRNGESLGVCLFLSTAQLEQLGVDTDAYETVEAAVRDGAVIIEGGEQR